MASGTLTTMQKRAAIFKGRAPFAGPTTFIRHGLASCLVCLMVITWGMHAYADAEHGTRPHPTDDHAKKVYSDDVIRRASSIARQTMSPFCPGRTLSDCPSEYATEWRSDIREMVAAGLSADEIQAELEKRAGGNLSGIPNRESSYVLPIALSVAAALVLYLVFARLRRPEEKVAVSKTKKGKTTPSPRSVDDNRLEAELDRED